MKKLISFVIPIYNEQAGLTSLYRELLSIWQRLNEHYDFELLFVNDGSTDNSGEELAKMSARDNRIKVIDFSRNFGKEIAISAGIERATGNAVIIMDGDLQHPPALLPDFLAKWEQGAEVVIGVRKKSTNLPILNRIGSYLYYQIASLISGVKSVPYATDYRLIDEQVAKAFTRFTEKDRVARGLIDWLGFKRDYIYFTSPARRYGKSAFNITKLTRLALSSFVSNSQVPLKIAGYLGIICVLVFGLLGIFIIIDRYILRDPFGFNFTNLAIVVVFIGFLVGIVLCCLGLIGLYIGNIQREIANRPLYIIRKNKKL